MPEDEDDEAPSIVQVHLSLTPDELKKDKVFQEHFEYCKNKLQNIILWWQQVESVRLKDDYEAIGKSVKMSEQMMKLLNECSGKNPVKDVKKPFPTRQRLKRKT